MDGWEEAGVGLPTGKNAWQLYLDQIKDCTGEAAMGFISAGDVNSGAGPGLDNVVTKN